MPKARNYEEARKAYQTKSVGRYNYFTWGDYEDRTVVIRILPHIKDILGEAGFENKFHKPIGVHMWKDNEGNDTSFKCPYRTNGDPCPACEKKNYLFVTKNKEDEKVARTLIARDRGLVNYIVRGVLDKGKIIPTDSEFKIYTMEAAKSFIGNILDRFNDLQLQCIPERATKEELKSYDAMDIEVGRDILVKRYKKENGFIDYSVSLAANPSPMVTKQEELQYIIDKVVPIEDYVVIESYEEIAARVGWTGTPEMGVKYVKQEEKKVFTPGNKPACFGVNFDEEEEKCLDCFYAKSCGGEKSAVSAPISVKALLDQIRKPK